MPVSELKSVCFKILWLTVSNVGMWLDTWGLMPRNLFWWAVLQHLKPRYLIRHEFRREHFIPHQVEMRFMGAMLNIEHKEVNFGTGLKFSFKSSSVQSYARPLWWSGICSQTLFLCTGMQIMCLWRGIWTDNDLVDGVLLHTADDVDLTCGEVPRALPGLCCSRQDR